jgi:hypothetical protein
VDAANVIAASGSGVTTGGRFVQPLKVASGRYLLKVAAVDAGGRSGSVERGFDARLAAAGAVRLSDVVLAEPGTPLRPAVTRVTGDRIVSYVELYGPAESSVPSARIVVDVIAESESAPLTTVPASISAEAHDRWIARADLSLRDLPAGEYRAVIHVAIPDAPRQRIERTIVLERQ